MKENDTSPRVFLAEASAPLRERIGLGPALARAAGEDRRAG